MPGIQWRMNGPLSGPYEQRVSLQRLFFSVSPTCTKMLRLDSRASKKEEQAAYLLARNHSTSDFDLYKVDEYKVGEIPVLWLICSIDIRAIVSLKESLLKTRKTVSKGIEHFLPMYVF